MGSWVYAQMPSIIDDHIINDPHFREEHGLNEFTRPSVDAIFVQLQTLAPLPLMDAPYTIPKRMPEERDALALQTGLLISEGFIAVQTGDMKRVQDIASSLSKHSNAIGAGDKMKEHASKILELAEKQDIENLKKELRNTQLDIEKELVLLQDVDLAHLISLGGWLRALHVSVIAIDKHFTEDRAKLIFREDIADYYVFALESMKPELKESERNKFLLEKVGLLKELMTLMGEELPTEGKSKAIVELTVILVDKVVGK